MKKMIYQIVYTEQRNVTVTVEVTDKRLFNLESSNSFQGISEDDPRRKIEEMAYEKYVSGAADVEYSEFEEIVNTEIKNCSYLD